MIRNQKISVAVVALAVLLTASCGFKRKKYDNPITKDTQQPDKVLFDKAIKDIEHGRYEVARLTLNTLINTYDTSEYLAKAKLAIADSWYREGGLHGSAQAEAEYKDFMLFYPTMEEAAESQKKICDDPLQSDGQGGSRSQQRAARRAGVQGGDDAVSQLEVCPGSRTGAARRFRKCWRKRSTTRVFSITTRARIRRRRTASTGWWISIRCIATRMRRCGGSRRLQPHGSAVPAEAGRRAGENREGLSAEPAMRIRPRSKLESLEMAVPAADPAAVARMKYEKENYSRPGHASFRARISRRASGREPCGEVRHSDDERAQGVDSGERAGASGPGGRDGCDRRAGDGSDRAR